MRQAAIGKKREGHRVFARFLISYFFVLLLPVVSSIYIHQRTLAILKEDIVANNQAFLQKTLEIIDRPLKEIDSILSSLSFNHTVSSFLHMNKLDDGSPDIIKVRDVWELLESFVITGGFIRDIMIVSQRNGIAVSKSIPFSREDIFYGNLFEYLELPVDYWANSILQNYHHKSFLPAAQVQLVENRFTAISFLQSIPLDSPKDRSGLIIVLIDGDEIKALLKNLNLGGRGSVYIIDADGEAIISVGSNVSVDEVPEGKLPTGAGTVTSTVAGEKTLISFATSQFNGWRYVVSIPIQDVISRLSFIRRLLLIILLGGVVAGIAVAVLLAYRNAKPIRELIDLLRGQRAPKAIAKGDTYNLLHAGVTELLKKNEELSSALREQQPIVQSTFFRRLLEGYFSSEKEIRVFLDHAGLNLDAQWYAVSEMRIDGVGNLVSGPILDDLAIARLHIRQTVSGLMPSRCYFHEETPHVVTVIGTFDKLMAEECSSFFFDRIRTAVSQLSEQFNLPVSAGLSTVFSDLRSIGIAYSEAQRALPSGEDGSDPVLEYSGAWVNPDQTQYTFEVEKRLVHYVSLGRKPEVINLIERLFENYFDGQTLLDERKAQLIHSLCHTAARFLIEHGIEYPMGDTEKAAMSASAIETSCEAICRCFGDICERLIIKKDVNENKLRHKITDYVDSNYADSMLTLYSLASVFSYSESYLYHFFIQRVGMSFSAYLEKVRMVKATSLLKENGRAIDKVAEECGYNSGHSFRRAFKRVTGMTPTEFRSVTSRTA